jgi:hypothetical protein
MGMFLRGFWQGCSGVAWFTSYHGAEASSYPRTFLIEQNVITPPLVPHRLPPRASSDFRCLAHEQRQPADYSAGVVCSRIRQSEREVRILATVTNGRRANSTSKLGANASSFHSTGLSG